METESFAHLFSCPIRSLKWGDGSTFRITERAYQHLGGGGLYFLRSYKMMHLTWDGESPDQHRSELWIPFVQYLRRIGPFWTGVWFSINKSNAPKLTDFVMDYGEWPITASGIEFIFVNQENDAENPGRLKLSDKLLGDLHPELFQEPPGFLGKLKGHGDKAGQAFSRDNVARQLYWGNAEPAVVLALDPLVIAAFSKDMDDVLLLRFPSAWSNKAIGTFGLSVTKRLITVNWFVQGKELPDLPLQSSRNFQKGYTNFQPMIGEFLSEDRDCLRIIHDSINEIAWENCLDLGTRKLKAQIPLRDGRPLVSFVPADFQSKDYAKSPYIRYVPSEIWERELETGEPDSPWNSEQL